MLQRQNYTSLELKLFVELLYAVGAIKIDTEKGFTLKLHETKPDAPLSPLYFNLRTSDNKQGPLSYTDVQHVAEFMFLYIRDKHLQFEGICGIPRAGNPFAEEVQGFYHRQLETNMPRLLLDKYESYQIRHIGNITNRTTLKPGSKVLLIDDLITKADSKREAIGQLRNAGYVIEDCLVFLDREQGGTQQMFENGIRLHSILGLQSVLLILKDYQHISEAQFNQIRQYLKENA